MPRIALLRILLLLVTAALFAPSAASAQTPAACVNLEAQSWWQKTGPLGSPGSMEHTHSGACFPYKQVISGSFTLDVTVKMHNQPGRYLTQVRIDDATDQDADQRFSAPAPNLLCSSANCAFTVPVTVNTDVLPTGMHEWRVGASTAPAPSNSTTVAERDLATTGWQICIRSCTGRTPANDRLENRGWYRTDKGGGALEVVGYEVARWGWLSSHDAEFPWNPATGTFRPISGIWQPPIESRQGAQDGLVEPIRRSRAWLDPDFHNGNNGTQLLGLTGPFQGRLLIDTSTIANGMHKLVVESGSDQSYGEASGVMVVPFLVSNA